MRCRPRRRSIGSFKRHGRATAATAQQLADWYARGRRAHTRRKRQFTATDWAQVQELLREDWSPDQVVGWLRRFHVLDISHETIYRYIWADKRAGGTLPPTPARRPQTATQALRPLRQPRPPRRQAHDHRTAGERRDAARARPLGGRHDARRQPGRSVCLEPRRAEDRVPAARAVTTRIPARR